MGVCICVYMYTYRFAFANAASIMVCNGIVCVCVRMCACVCVCVCVCVDYVCARGSCINLWVYLIGLPLDCGHTLLHIMLSACFLKNSSFYH